MIDLKESTDALSKAKVALNNSQADFAGEIQALRQQSDAKIENLQQQIGLLQPKKNNR